MNAKLPLPRTLCADPILCSDPRSLDTIWTVSDPVTACPAICLNMIVRNEAHIIHEALDSVAPYITSWVIVDTGSDDGTQDLIRNHMAGLGIPGELYERPWRNFGHNRSEALTLAQGHGDYIWVIDADDTLVGAPDFTRLGADIYWLRYRGGTGGNFWLAQLFRDGVRVRWVGVTHEYAAWDDSHVDVRLEGEYHIADRQLSARNLEGQKSTRDRDLLLAEVERDPEDARSVFYLAESYFFLGDFVNALKWHERRVAMGGWDEEVYAAMCRVAESMSQLGAPWLDVQDAYLRAWDFRPTRAEPLHDIARRYREEQRYAAGYLFAKRAAEIPLPEAELMYVRRDVYAWRAIDEQAVCASWIDKQAEAFTLWRRLLARPDVPDEERPRITGNRDVCVPTMIDAASSYPDALVRSLLAGTGEAEVVVSLVAGPDRETTEHTLNSFLRCCLDASRVGRFLVLDAGLPADDRAMLQQRYGFLEFGPSCSADEPGSQLAHLREHIDGQFWLHLGEGWRFFAPENFITRLEAVLEAETQVFQVGINFTDAVKLTGTCADETAVRRAPGAGRYVLTDAVASGPAMFDTTRLDRAGGEAGTDPDPIADLDRRAAATELHTASLDEVLCIADRADGLATGVVATRRRRCRAGFEKIFNVSLHRSGTKSVHELLLRSGIASVHWPIIFRDVNYEDQVAGHESDRSYVAATLSPVIEAMTAVSDVPIPALYDLLDSAYPNSAFILMFRSPFDWVRSVRNHVGNRDLDPFERVQYWRYFPSQPASLHTIDDAALYSAFLTHHRDVLNYFENRGNCLFLDLQQPEAGQKICSFLGLPPTELHRIDVSIRVT
jgi:Sulfotransferase domain/Glycosyl transferase family 2